MQQTSADEESYCIAVTAVFITDYKLINRPRGRLVVVQLRGLRFFSFRGRR